MPIKLFEGDKLARLVFSCDFSVNFIANTIDIFNSDSMAYESVHCKWIKVYDKSVEAYL